MIRMVNDSTPEWGKASGSVPVRTSTPINQGGNKGVRSGYCTFLLGTTVALTLLGLIALLSSSPKDEEAGYRLLKVAKASGDVVKSVCNC